MSLTDIVDTREINGTIAITFNTGNVIKVQSTDNLSAAMSLPTEMPCATTTRINLGNQLDDLTVATN